MSEIFFQVIVPIITLVVGAWLGAWFTAWSTRPKLKIISVGMGGATWVGVSNRPGVAGITLNETIVFGKRIHPRIVLGPSVDRATANECRAIIYDKSDDHPFANLYWRTTVDGQTRMTPIVNIKSAESCDLMLLARQSDEPTKYFIYKPKRDDTSEPGIPAGHVKLSGTRTFTVRISYSDHSKLEFDYTVREEYGGTLSIQSKYGGGGF